MDEYFELRSLVQPSGTSFKTSLAGGNESRQGLLMTPETPHRNPQPPLPLEQDFGPVALEHAFVWMVYNEESSKTDASLADSSNRGIDVLLVFTGLFSAVLTTFIIQAYQLLISNQQDATNDILTQLYEDRIGQSKPAEALVNGPPLEHLLWVNGLWFAALASCLSAALVCMLAKQWLLTSPNISGSPRYRSRHRQRRYMQMQTWRVMTVIHALPLLLHATLLLFFTGLLVLLWSGNRVIKAVTFVIVALVYGFYFGSMWLSLIYPESPFQHPVSHQLRRLLFPKKSGSRSTAKADLENGYRHVRLQLIEEDRKAAENTIDEDFIDASALVWLLEQCPNRAATPLALQAIGDLPRNFTAFHVLRKAGTVPMVLQEFAACFHRDSTLDSEWHVLKTQDAERYCRAWMRLTSGTSHKWPQTLMQRLEKLTKLEDMGNVNAIATCTRAIAYNDSNDGRLGVIAYLAQCTEPDFHCSYDMQCWLLETFLECSLASPQGVRPKHHITTEVVPVFLRLIHLTKHALASNVRSALAMSLSYMTDGFANPALFKDEATWRKIQTFYDLLIPALTAIVENPESHGVDDDDLDLAAVEFARLASLCLIQSEQSHKRKHLKPIAQRGLMKLYLDGRIRNVKDDVMADVLQILYPLNTLVRRSPAIFVQRLLQTLEASSDPRMTVHYTLRLLEPLLREQSTEVMDAFIEGKGIETLLHAARTTETDSRRVQLDCVRALCIFIGTTAEYHLNSSGSSLNGTDDMDEVRRLGYIFGSNFFQTLWNVMSAKRSWWLPEVVLVWVPSLVKLCELRPHEPVWQGIETAFRKFAENNVGKDGYEELVVYLDDMREFMDSLPSPVIL